MPWRAEKATNEQRLVRAKLSVQAVRNQRYLCEDELSLTVFKPGV